MTSRAANMLMLVLALWGAWAPSAMAAPVLLHRAPVLYPTGYDEWIADAVVTAKHHGARWEAGTYGDSSPGPTPLDEAVAYGQYDPGYGYLRIAQHVGGDAELEGYANDANDTWRDLYSIPQSGAITGFRNLTDGLRLDWTENADTTSRDALINQAVSAAFAASGNMSGEYDIRDEALSREIAYAAEGYINAEVYAAQTHNARLLPYVLLMLGDVDEDVTIGMTTANLDSGGHIEQWLGSYTTDASGNYVSGSTNFVSTNFAPFMGAITAHALSRYYDEAADINGGITPDARTVDKIERLFDAIWNETWGTANNAPDNDSFYYRPDDYDGDGSTNDVDGEDSNGETYSVNNLIAFGYWWLYKQTGDIRHLNRGDAAFLGSLGCDSFTYRGVEDDVYYSKEFNELTRWTIDGLEIRAEGVVLHGG